MLHEILDRNITYRRFFLEPHFILIDSYGIVASSFVNSEISTLSGFMDTSNYNKNISLDNLTRIQLHTKLHPGLPYILLNIIRDATLQYLGQLANGTAARRNKIKSNINSRLVQAETTSFNDSQKMQSNGSHSSRAKS